MSWTFLRQSGIAVTGRRQRIDAGTHRFTTTADAS
jgi:hypothetical protein